MKHLVFVLAAIGACSGTAATPAPAPQPPPTPEPVVIVSEPDAAAKATNTCSAACARLVVLGCKSWAPDGGTCAGGCAAASEAMGASLSLSCVTKATTCGAAARCLK